jgi:ParB family transcriptional regulator, chromosome partitioning protein
MSRGVSISVIDHDQQPVMLTIPPQQTKQVFSLRVEEVRPKASQVRQSFSEIEALACSIIQEGQIQPIVVSPQNSEGVYLIQQGERRWRACQQAGLETIEAIIADPKVSELDEIAGELIENIQREALSSLEIAHALQHFVQQGWQQKAIAKRLGKTSSFISTHLSLLKMADCLVALYEVNITRDTETLNNLRQLHDLAPQIGEQVCQVALQKGITRQQSRELLNEAKKEAGRAPKAVQRSKVSFEIPADPQQAGLSVTPTSRSLVPETQVNSATVIEAEHGEAEAIDGTSALLAEEVEVETETSKSRGGATCSAELTPRQELPSSETRWRAIPAEALRIVVNVLNETDFQPGILMTDRIDHQTDHLWVKIWQGGQEKLVRVPVADIELVRLEAIADD